MKKNNIMRLASFLLVAVMLSTCAIGGTFAKYTAEAQATDSARVAKWGVTLTVPTDSSFATTYSTDDTNYSGTISVSSSSTEEVVAPGTSGTAIKFSISGTPEVATKVDIAMNVTSDINVNDTYYPVVFTLTQNGTEVAKGNLAAIKAAVEAYAATAYYAPKTDLSAEFELTWTWEFGDGTNDTNDTLIANVAAGTVTDTTVDTELEYTITFTVTQVD